MARETAAEKKLREAKERKALKRKERRAAERRAKETQGEAVDPNPLRQLDHQIGRLSYELTRLSETADLVRPRKPIGVEQLHRRVVVQVFDNKGIRIGESQHDLTVADDLTLTVSASEIAATISSGDR